MKNKLIRISKCGKYKDALSPSEYHIVDKETPGAVKAIIVQSYRWTDLRKIRYIKIL